MSFSALNGAFSVKWPPVIPPVTGTRSFQETPKPEEKILGDNEVVCILGYGEAFDYNRKRWGNESVIAMGHIRPEGINTDEFIDLNQEGIALSNSSTDSMTALYPAKFAWEDKTSIDCALVILGRRLSEKILISFLVNLLTISLFKIGSNCPINIDLSFIKSISSLDG